MAVSTIDNSGISASAAISTSKLGTGAVLQVVQATSTLNATTSSSSMVATGIGASITPTSSSSKVLIIIQTSLYGGSNGMGISIARGTTVVWSPSVYDGGYYGALINANPTRILSSIQYLDSPATTSSTTYNLYFGSRNAATATINPSDTTPGGTSIILMEIAG